MTDDYDRISDDWFPVLLEENAAHLFDLLTPLTSLPNSRWFDAWAKLDMLRIRRETGDLV